MDWELKVVESGIVKEIAAKYSVDLLTASILARRVGNESKDIIYYLEDDKRYLRSPFELNGIEDAVERILAAKEEGEKVLVFGDRDADGVTSLGILVSLLKSMGIDVSWRVPCGDDPYGLTIAAVDDFAKEYGTLIVTVDCGISNYVEIAHAKELNIDVIVTDHHKQPEVLPDAYAIVDPKLKVDDRYLYAFPDLAGCGVAYKLASALRFAQKSAYYAQSVCLLNVRPGNDGAMIIDVLKVRNMVVVDRLSETINEGLASFQDTRLPEFLCGQAIMAWDVPVQKKLLAKIFGNGIEFSLIEMQTEVAKIIPQAAGASLMRLKDVSRIAKYYESALNEIDVFYNLFISFIQIKENHFSDDDDFDLQLAAVGTIADLMPLENENRILVRSGIASIIKKTRPGLSDLLFKLDLAGRQLGSKDISWILCPVINAAGRLGRADVCGKLMLENDLNKREQLVNEIITMNDERKTLGETSWAIAEPIAAAWLDILDGKLAFSFGENIQRGATGITANRLVNRFKVPALVISITDDIATGSLRSAKGYDLQGLLDQVNDLFIDCGGHGFAAGFRMDKKNWDVFIERLTLAAKTIEFPADKNKEDTLYIDAQIPLPFLNPEIFKVIDKFEPYGKDNRDILFITKGLIIRDIIFVGKHEAKHVKLLLDTGKFKWPALYWNAAEKVQVDFDKNDTVDVVYHIERNWFKGNCTAQMCVADLKRSKS
ncbi:MAG: single-stranded-DNA-specific exonuclease RecJ [Termitinemataceae bacterium]|nr:MAG: single-stranded-DNA-specific exonuclease RecJ [Termitinemataceae bacterium]